MTVLFTISETLSGAELSDGLVGDIDAVGCDLGSVQNSSYSPKDDQSLNTGHQNLFLRHDAVIDPCTDCGFFLQNYGTDTGFTYGGARSPSDDIAALKDLGDASGTSKNNSNGLSGGIWLDQKWDATSVQQFDKDVSKVNIFKTAAGFSLATKIGILKESMVYDNAGVETAATLPVDGVIGISSDTAKGSQSHIKQRIYIPEAYSEGGYYQFEQVLAYSFTA